MKQPLLRVEDLKVTFATEHGKLRAVDGVSLTVEPGQTLGIVGESGSGKTVLSRSMLGLLPPSAGVSAKGIWFQGQNLLGLPQKDMQKLRGKEIGVIFQDPMTSLNPVMTIGLQIMETLRHHLGMTKGEARERGEELLASVSIPSPARRLGEYPHQLSGGMRQRVVIAMALSCGPKLLIADEPTTALDVTVQAQILDLLRRFQQDHHMAMILISHDLGVVAGRTDEIAVMYAGQIVERAPTLSLFKNTRMPYTEALLKSIPHIEDKPHKRLRAISGRP
ncbi:MAG: ABC transporter ATP-binding protein, partial [Candidatus Methylomirabilales bacterium]